MPAPAASENLNGSPSRSQRRPLFGFGEPREGLEDGLPSSELPSPAPSPEEESRGSLADLAPDSEDDWLGPDDESPAATPSTASSSDVSVLDSEGLRDMFRGGVIIAGDQAHNLLAKSEGQKAVGLYATDNEDAERIGDPLARIAGRHQGIGAVNPDTQDLLAAMVGLTRYATKQVQKGQAARQLDAGYSAPAEPVDL